MTHPITRRSLLRTGAASAALIAAGAGLSTLTSCTAGAQENEEGPGLSTGEVQIPTTCNACSNKCGMMATVRNGKLIELAGIKDHPYSKGRICGRGHGFATLAYSSDRVTEPLKRLEDDTFQPVSWEEALSDIGQRMKSILAEHGPESVSFINDPRPSGKEWGSRFMHALGSNNIYTHAASCNLSKESGFVHTIGASNFSADISHAKEILFIGRSYGDGIRPSSALSISAAQDAQTKIVLVDPRLSNTGVFADQWIPIKPGCDLALLLAIAHVLVSEDLYNKEFIETQTSGFNEWQPIVMEYTPEWASEICDVPADTIRTLARELAAKAPAAVVEPSWRAAFGCSYRNSTDCARAVCLVNALLGNWNQKGGALITSTPKPHVDDPEHFPTPSKPKVSRVGDTMYPLDKGGSGSAPSVVEQALDGKAHAVFFYTSNAMYGYGKPEAWEEAMKQVDLKVCIDVQMSETALQCDYVLPECTFVERTEVPDFLGGKKWVAAIRRQVIDVVHPETKPADEIFNLLAQACGVGETFTYNAEELGRAQAASLGVDYDKLCEVGALPFDGSTFDYGQAPTWKTPTGKLQFKSPAHEEAGLDPFVRWVEPKVMPKKGEFRLIGGKQGIHSHSMTTNVPVLNEISREYDMERVWVNAQAARELGINDGDLVELSNAAHTAQVRARVTERVRPDTLFMPTHYGRTSPYMTRAVGLGVNNAHFTEFELEPGVGSIMSQEIAVTLKKVD